ncbi:MAG: intradiol ring-cleavage dioxygenase [Herbaspirillum sp.]|jgi:protocatechuate 3,4-dioxygenase beta subunit|nr:intradiol ring-cleavage dioxygenase [Herbaspirillum sp.]
MTSNKFIDNEAMITEVVKEAMSRTGNPRLKEIMALLVEHAHAFVREANLTDEEFDAGVRFIQGIGQVTTDTHNEVVLASDALGISTLIAYRNHPQDKGQSASALLGPFWRLHAPDCENGDNIARSNTPGVAMYVDGVVRDTGGRPIPGACVDVWQASPVGLYESQDPEQESMNLRGKFRTDSQGRYRFRTVRPAGYPVPVHGPVGQLLKAQNRHPFRPAHIHFMVSAPACKTLVTQVFADDSEHLASDVVFGVTRALIGHFERHESRSPAHPDAPIPFFTLQHDFVLEQGVSSFPEPPIK